MLTASGRRKRALETYKKMGWGDNGHLRDVDEDIWCLTTDFLFGEVWSRPGLSLRDRELVTLAALITVKADGVSTLMRHAHHVGITTDEIKEVIYQVMYYAGQHSGFFAMRKLKALMAETPASARSAGKKPRQSATNKKADKSPAKRTSTRSSAGK